VMSLFTVRDYLIEKKPERSGGTITIAFWLAVLVGLVAFGKTGLAAAALAVTAVRILLLALQR